MASNYTPEFGLNQWSLEDSVIMEEFNTDNRKIEQALLDLKASLPKFQAGSYVGNGKYGAETPTTLTFDFEPQLVVLVQENQHANLNLAPTVCIRGVPQMVVAFDPGSFTEFRPVKLNMIWDGTTFSCYAGQAASQFNTQDITYHFWAIG